MARTRLFLASTAAFALVIGVGVWVWVATSGLLMPEKDEEDTAGSAKTSAVKNGIPASKTPLESWRSFRGGPGLKGWRAGRVADRFLLRWTYEEDTLIESTAAIVDGRVFIGTDDSGLLALELNPADKRGKLLWRAKTEAGIRASPLVSGNRVFFGDDSGIFHAVFADSGKPAWTFDTDTGSEIISSATFIDGRVLFGSYDGFLYCLSPESGDLLWKCETDGPVHATPAVAGARAFVAGCDGMLHGVYTATGKETPPMELEAQCAASPAVLGDHLFVGTLGGEVVCADLKTGKPVWRYEHPDRQREYHSSAAVGPLGQGDGGVVVIGCWDKLVHAIHTRSGESLWTFSTKAAVDASPVIVGERVLVAGLDGILYLLELATGKEIWRFHGGSGFAASPAVGEGVLVLANEDGQIYCLELNASP